MNNLKQTAIAILILICTLVVGIFIGRTFSKTEIKVVDRIVYKTEYKEPTPTEFNLQNFNKLQSWVNSPILFRDKTQENYLFVTAYDANKEATARYEIGVKGNWKIYGVVGVAGILTGGYLYYKYGK